MEQTQTQTWEQHRRNNTRDKAKDKERAKIKKEKETKQTYLQASDAIIARRCSLWFVTKCDHKLYMFLKITQLQAGVCKLLQASLLECACICASIIGRACMPRPCMQPWELEFK